jgi:hypothetical protein
MKPIRKAYVVVQGVEVERMVRGPRTVRVVESINKQRKMLWSGMVKAFGQEMIVYGYSYSFVSPPVDWRDRDGS